MRIGVNNSSILWGKIFINFPSISLYQTLCKLVKIGRRFVENQYCVGYLSSNFDLDQGVGSDEVQIGAKILNFK